LIGKDVIATDNTDKNPTLTFIEDPTIVNKNCEDGVLIAMHCSWKAIDKCGNCEVATQ
jgi:hypothetical protein